MRVPKGLKEALTDRRGAPDKSKTITPVIDEILSGVPDEYNGLLRKSAFGGLFDLLENESLGELMRLWPDAIGSQSGRRIRSEAQSGGVMLTIGPLGLAPFLAQFQHNHSSIEIEIHEGSLDELSRRLEVGELDFVLLNKPMGLDESFRIEAVYDEKYVVVFSPGHRLKGMAAIQLKDLSGESCVDRLSCEMREMVMAACNENEVKLYATYRSEREDSIQGMVLANMEFAFMPEYSVTASGMLSRPLIEPEVTRTIKMAWMSGRPHTPAGEAFVRAVRTYN